LASDCSGVSYAKGTRKNQRLCRFRRPANPVRNQLRRLPTAKRQSPKVAKNQSLGKASRTRCRLEDRRFVARGTLLKDETGKLPPLFSGPRR